MLMLLLPFLMNGKTGNMTNVLTEIMKTQQGSMNPMALLLLSMMSKDAQTKKAEEGTDAIKDFGGEDVLRMLKLLMQNKNKTN